MASWGTFRRAFQLRDRTSDSDEYVNNFFRDTIEKPEWEMTKVATQIDEFIRAQHACGWRIVVVTSGSTMVPMEEKTVTFMDAKSSGNRGAACAEYFLKRGYAVVFLHREGSLMPFSRHFAKFIKRGDFMGLIKVDEDANQLVFNTKREQTDKLVDLLKANNETKHRLLSIEFTTAQHYLMLLRTASQALDIASHRGMLLLAAAVMDYYIPDQHIAKHRAHNEDDFSVNFSRVPHLVRKIRQEWCPKAFLVTFKLETDPALVSEQAHLDLEKWGINLVIGNTLSTRRELLTLVTEHEEIVITRPPTSDIETPLVAHLVHVHRDFSRQRSILQRSKQLLLLSAKFAMMKENDVLNEDAEGNKNVPFKTGVRIKVDRRLGDASPVYELKKIFRNQSHSARAHVWERMNTGGAMDDDAKQNDAREVLVSFSPAGTPDTIKNLWGDFWSGWADDQIQEAVSQLSKLSLTSALNVVAAPFTGDFSSTTALLNFVMEKFGAAWAGGEQTRIRQTVQNVFSIGFVRSLVEFPSLHPLPDVLNKLPSVPRRASSFTIDDWENFVVKSSSSDSASTHELKEEEGSSSSSSRSLDETISMLQKEDLLLETESLDDDDAPNVVRIHKTIGSYFEDMQKAGIVPAVLPYLQRGYTVNCTGYSMGGMLAQLFMLALAEEARLLAYDTSKLQMIGFGTPRVGDRGFRARLLLHFDASQLLNVMHPSDTVHSFPPRSEGYVDSTSKIFLKEEGCGIARRRVSRFSILPTARAIDRIFEKAFQSASETEAKMNCGFCGSSSHSSERHRCRYCTECGTHRGSECPNKNARCTMCGKTNHSTGFHKCRVCHQYGHRGRDCHSHSDVGSTELFAYFQYHHFLYYSEGFKKSVDFSSS